MNTRRLHSLCCLLALLATPGRTIDLSLDVHWGSYPTPALEGPAPQDPDLEAISRQIGLSLGVTWVVSLGREEENR